MKKLLLLMVLVCMPNMVYAVDAVKAVDSVKTVDAIGQIKDVPKDAMKAIEAPAQPAKEEPVKEEAVKDEAPAKKEKAAEENAEEAIKIEEPAKEEAPVKEESAKEKAAKKEAEAKEALKTVNDAIKKYGSWTRLDKIFDHEDYISTILGASHIDNIPEHLMLTLEIIQRPKEDLYLLGIILDDAETANWKAEDIDGKKDIRAFDAVIRLDGNLYNVKLVNFAEDHDAYDISNTLLDGPAFYKAIDKGAQKMTLYFNTASSSEFKGLVSEETFNISGTYEIYKAMINYMKVR